jgi:hypothetical protein
MMGEYDWGFNVMFRMMIAGIVIIAVGTLVLGAWLW